MDKVMNQNAGTRLKIVMVVTNNTYPADPRVRNEAETLAAAGHQVTVIAAKAKGQSGREHIKGVTALRYPAAPEGTGVLAYALELSYVSLVSALMVLLVLVRDGMDVLHMHNPPDILFITGLIPKLLGKKLVFDHHDLAPELYLAKFGSNKGFVYRFLRLLENLTCRIADHVIVVNESYAGIDIERNGVDRDDITIVRNGPSMALLSPEKPDAEIRTRASFVGGYLGHIAKQDGVDHLITALHHLQKDFGFEDWHVLIIGPSDDFSPLKQLADQLGVSDKLTFTGYQPQQTWRTMLASTDVCFVPDPNNPLNDKSTMTKMMDYMALGKPIVAYDLTENQVSAGEAALYAEASDPKDFARQIMRLVEDKALRQRLGECGRKRIREKLAWDYSAQALRHLYDSGLAYRTAESHV